MPAVAPWQGAAPARSFCQCPSFTSSLAVSWGFRAVGAYPLSELEDTVRAALASPHRPALRGAVFDARESAVIESRTTAEVRDAAALIAGLSEEFGRRVALIGQTDVQYGLMRVLAAWADDATFEVDVFRDPAEAFTWAER